MDESFRRMGASRGIYQQSIDTQLGNEKGAFFWCTIMCIKLHRREIMQFRRFGNKYFTEIKALGAAD